MLVKIDGYYLTLGTFTLAQNGTGDNYFIWLHGAKEGWNLSPQQSLEIKTILDEAIAAQQTIQQQVEAMNKQQAELQAKAQEIAAYETQLMQKAAQVDAAYAAMQQNKSPVILPPGFGRKHRG